MAEEELKLVYLELIQEELNRFKGKTIEEVPGPIKLAIEKLIEYDSKDSTVQSEGMSDLKQTFFEVKDLPGDVRNLLKPYKSLGW